MKYALMRFDGSLRQYQSPQTIYVVPVSSDDNSFRILYPVCMNRRKLKNILGSVITIKQFESCTAEAVIVVRDKLDEMLERGLEAYTTGLNSLVFGGIVVAVLGIIDFTFPDALPLADELLLTFGGAAMAVAGYLAKRGNLPAYRDKVRRKKAVISELEGVDDPLISRIFNSIREKESPESEMLREMDKIEAESQWFVKYINIEEMIEEGEISADQAREIMAGIQDIIPIRKIIKYEKKTHLNAARKKAKRLRDKAVEKTGISQDALTVYCEFYKSFQEYLIGRGN